MISRIVDKILLTFAKISIPRRFNTNKMQIPTTAIAFTVIPGRRLFTYKPNASAKELFRIGVTSFVYATSPPALTPDKFVTIE